MAVWLVAVRAAGCGRGEAERFVAFERDFQGFRRWEGGAFEERPARGQAHHAGEQRFFIRRPDSAVRAGAGGGFAVGTVIVKEARLSARPEGQLFAMVKRGGGYNAEGATGWEWFELWEREDGSVAIKWRGMSAPSGEQYGADPHGSCNGCHREASASDFVMSSAVRR